MGKMALLWYASWIVSIIVILYVIKINNKNYEN